MKMKTLKLTILIILMIIGYNSSAQYDSIFAIVSGNTVTLWQTGAYRNCGSEYRMELQQVDHNITWYQADTGMLMTCGCFFDLSVTFMVPESGYYTVDVYSSDSLFSINPVYEGSTFFTIGDDNASRDGILSQYQSDCYQNIGIGEEGVSKSVFKLYPVPLRDGDQLHMEAFPGGSEAILEIYTMTGKLLFSKYYDSSHPIKDQFIKEELFPVSGIYLVRLTTSDHVLVKQITVF
jgi:hypothetical protein